MLRSCGLAFLALSLVCGSTAKEKNAPRPFDATELVNKALEAKVASLLPSLDGKGKARKAQAALNATAARRLAAARKLQGEGYYQVEHIDGRGGGDAFCNTWDTGLYFQHRFQPPRCVKDNGDVVKELSVHGEGRLPYAASLSPAEFERACGARGGRVMRDRSCESVVEDWMHNGGDWPWSHYFERDTPDLPERWPECCQQPGFQVPGSSMAPDNEGFSMCLPGEYVQPDKVAGKQCRYYWGMSDFEYGPATHNIFPETHHDYGDQCHNDGGQMKDLMCQEVERRSQDPYLDHGHKLALRKVRREVRERCCSVSPPSRDNAGDICPGALLSQSAPPIESKCCGLPEPDWPKPQEPRSGSEWCQCVGKSHDVRMTQCDTPWRDCPAVFYAEWNNWEQVVVPGSYGERCASHISQPQWDPECFDDGSGDGNATQRPSRCGMQWCYVDPCACDQPDLHSSWLFAQSGGDTLYYSYATCGGYNFDGETEVSDDPVSYDTQRDWCLSTQRWWSQEVDYKCDEYHDHNNMRIQDAYQCRQWGGELRDVTCAQMQDELQHQGKLQHQYDGGQLPAWQLGRSVWSQCCNRAEFPRQCPTLQASSFDETERFHEAERALCRDRGVARERIGGQGCFYKHNHTLMSHFPPLPKGNDPAYDSMREACGGTDGGPSWYLIKDMTCEELLPVVFMPPGSHDSRSELQRCLIADELAARCCRNEEELGGRDVRGYRFEQLCPQRLNGEYRFFKLQDRRPVYRHNGNRAIWMEYNEPEATYEIFENNQLKVRLTSPFFEINLKEGNLTARFMDPECLDYLPAKDISVLKEKPVSPGGFSVPRGCTTVNKQRACDAEAVACEGRLGCGAEESDYEKESEYENQDTSTSPPSNSDVHVMDGVEYYVCYDAQANCQCSKAKVDEGHCGGPPGCYHEASSEQCENYGDRWLG